MYGIKLFTIFSYSNIISNASSVDSTFLCFYVHFIDLCSLLHSYFLGFTLLFFSLLDPKSKPSFFRGEHSINSAVHTSWKF